MRNRSAADSAAPQRGTDTRAQLPRSSMTAWSIGGVGKQDTDASGAAESDATIASKGALRFASTFDPSMSTSNAL